MPDATRRNRLFRLILLLKLAMWIVIAAILVIGIRDLIHGRETGPPMALLLAIPGLICAQLLAFAVWRRTGRRK